MDYEALRAWHLVEGQKAPETVYDLLRRCRFMQRHGINWDAFLADPAAAREQARAFLAWCKTNRAPTAPRNYAKCLNSVTEWAASRDTRFQGLRWDLPKEMRSEGRTLTPNEIQRLRSYTCPDWRVQALRRAMLAIHEGGGIRRSEGARLRLRDVDPAQQRIYIAFPAKGGERRWLKMPAMLFHPKRPLSAWLRLRPTLAPGDALWVIQSRGAWRPPSVVEYAQELWHVGKDLGFPVSSVRFRRAHFTLLDAYGVPTTAIQKRAGHSRITSTVRYVATTQAAADAALKRAKVPGY